MSELLSENLCTQLDCNQSLSVKNCSHVIEAQVASCQVWDNGIRVAKLKFRELNGSIPVSKRLTRMRVLISLVGCCHCEANKMQTREYVM